MKVPGQRMKPCAARWGLIPNLTGNAGCSPIRSLLQTMISSDKKARPVRDVLALLLYLQRGLQQPELLLPTLEPQFEPQPELQPLLQPQES